MSSISSNVFLALGTSIFVVLPNSVTTIGKTEFCSSLKSVIIPDEVKSIGECVFGDCGPLTKIFISEIVASLDTNPFCTCGQLRSIEIAEGN